MLSKKVLSIAESATLATAQKARELAQTGVDVISMSLGEPDFPPPDLIKNAAIKAIQENISFYSPVPGFLDLRTAIKNKLKRDNNLDYKENQIVVSNGAKQSIANMIISLCDEGDEVVLPAPYWVSYYDVIKFVGGKPIVISSSIESDFKITPEQLDGALNNKTKLFLFSNPCNPTGTVYTQSELEALAKVFEKYPNVLIASDEIYEYIVFEGNFFSFGAIPSLKDRVITINGLSKAFAITGWRLGYLAAPEKIAMACSKIQSQFTSGANSIAQKAAIVALDAGPSCVSYMKDAFRLRRDRLIKEINDRLPGVITNHPNGAFYLFPDMSCYYGKGNIKNSDDLSFYLLQEAHVAITPGEPFGAPNCMRFSYALSEERIVEAVIRIEKALKKL